MNFKWIMERVERCEQQIWSVSKGIAKSESDVILDLAFTKFSKRKLFRSLAKEENIQTQFHFVHAPLPIRRKRVLERNIEKGETFSFEVTPGMFDFMESEFEKPYESELEHAIIVDTSAQ